MPGSCLFMLAAAALCIQSGAPIAAASQKQAPLKPGLYARFDTSMGTFVCELYAKAAPLAVENFVGLAEGSKEWLSPKGDMLKKPFYDGIVFHRIIKGFMIQAGDITGVGTFRSVIPFRDEIRDTLRFDRAGVLAMANNGPNTNGSQFFITVAPAAHLNGLHTIFGRVVQGYNVVEQISKVPVGVARKPLQQVTIQKVSILRVGRP